MILNLEHVVTKYERLLVVLICSHGPFFELNLVLCDAFVKAINKITPIKFLLTNKLWACLRAASAASAELARGGSPVTIWDIKMFG